MQIHEATPDEAAAIIALLDRLYGETQFLLYERGEMNVPVETYSARMTEGIQKGSWYMFLAEEESAMIGAVFGSRGYTKRTWHSVTVGLGVLKDHWGKGAGRALIEAAEGWARRQGAHRLELAVQTTNNRASALYERLGFAYEGTKRESQFIGGQYIDEHIMAKFLGPK